LRQICSIIRKEEQEQENRNAFIEDIGQLNDMMSSKQRGSECLNPLEVISGNKDDVAKMFGTHDWDVDSEKPYGEGGVVIHYSCKNCNAEGYSLVTTKDSPTSKLIERRILNPVMESPRL